MLACLLLLLGTLVLLPVHLAVTVALHQLWREGR